MTTLTKDKRQRLMMPSENLRKLVDMHGYDRAAQMLGIAKSSIYPMLSKNTCSAPIEYLAAPLLKASGETVSRDRLLIMKVTPAQMTGLRPVLDAFGVRIAFADDAE